MQVRAFKRYIPLRVNRDTIYLLKIHKEYPKYNSVNTVMDERTWTRKRK